MAAARAGRRAAAISVAAGTAEISALCITRRARMPAATAVSERLSAS